jgi:endonuclease-8
MPEGDTVFRTAAALREALVGRTLTRCDIRVPRYATVDLSGSRIDEVLSRGKHLFIRAGSASFHSHLKMDGSWRVSPRGRTPGPEHKVRILLEAGDIAAVGIDLGVLEILDREHDMEAVAHLGPDLLGPDWDARRAAANLVADPHRPIAAALLDQSVMAGVGNVYCNELCFLFGRLPPARPAACPNRSGWSPRRGTCCGPIDHAGRAQPPVTPDRVGSCGYTAAAVNRAGGAAHR